MGKETDMYGCLNCDQPCNTTSIYCDSCRSLLEDKADQRERQTHSDVADAVTVPIKAVALDSEAVHTNGNDEVFPHATVGTVFTENPITSSALDESEYTDIVEQTLRMLNEAAQRIEAFEQLPRRYPRPSRLSRYRDISSEIHRQSTPMPQTSKTDDLNKLLVAIWPWLEDDEESEQDVYSSNHTDPLSMRQLPVRISGLPIEQEKLESTTGPIAFSLPGRRFTIVRLVMFCLILFALFGFITDSVLVTVALLRSHSVNSPIVSGPPTLILVENKVDYGQIVHARVIHFSAATSVFLTHDISERIKTGVDNVLMHVNNTGSADAAFSIDGTWSPGFHTLEAEDMTTHYTASATLQVMSGSTLPARLNVSSTSLNFGADMQGTNTAQALTFYNSGSGTISWSASSNQSWLLIAPTRGIYSDSQPAMVGVQRSNLKPGSYSGKITISTDVGGSQQIQVAMVVSPLHSGLGAVLSVTPAVMAFTTHDGAANPGPHFLMISNPGSQNLYWSLMSNLPNTLSDQVPASNMNWLGLDQTAGVVEPGMTSLIRMHTYSQNLLPGTYINTLLFNVSLGHTILDMPQNVAVALTVQSQCGVKLGSGSLSFTAVTGQGNPGSQTLNLVTGSGCVGMIPWQASSSANWLTSTPAEGELASGAQTTTTIGVNIGALKPATYTASLSIVVGRMSQSVAVQLVVQSPPPPTAPIIAISPLNLNFSATQGQSNPPGQTVTITNTGKSSLIWHTIVNMSAPSWLESYPSGGTIPPNASTQLTVNVSPQSLTPGTYTGQIMLNGSATNGVVASGGPQAIMVNFTLLGSCTLARLSANSLAFNVVSGSTNVTPLAMTMTATGDCSWPLKWQARMLDRASWLKLSARGGSFSASGQSVALSVFPIVVGLKPGNYSARVMVKSTDSNGVSTLGSSQIFMVVLNITQPCTLQVPSTGLSFTVAKSQSATILQNLTVGDVGSCVSPISWTATVDVASSAWLTVSPASGKDSATIAVNVNTASLAIGTYMGTITIAARESSGSAMQGSPIVVPVTLVVA